VEIVMTINKDLQSVLEKARAFEKYYALSQYPGGWASEDVGIDPTEIAALVEAGLVRRVRDDHGRLVDVEPGEDGTGYRLTTGEISTNIRAAFLDLPEPIPVSVPDDLFDSIVGYEDVKELLLAALRIDKPVHVLLVGPPALAKSLFLWDIERVFGPRALWLLGSATSQAGMWDLVADQQPDVLLLDEFEKIKGVDQAALLSLMEGGRLVRAKVGRGLNLNLECRVFAAANTTRGLTPEILSRFARRELRPYSQAEFQDVVTSVLVQREGVDVAVAAEIAARLVGRTQDVRDAIRAARLSQQMDPQRAIELLGVA
jgi:Holliday junction DNA helicase RuvB